MNHFTTLLERANRLGDLRAFSAPCPSSFVPDDDGVEVTEWDLADHLDAAITALLTVQTLDLNIRDGKVDRRDWLATIERMKGLLDVARTALDEAPL